MMKKKAETAAFYICSFFVYCVIGWIYEVIVMYSRGFGFVNRGYLHGCYIPIYGFCSLFFLIVLNGIRKRKFAAKPFVIFFSVLILSSLIEYSASYILEKFFNLRLWNYSDYKYNLNGRIALESSIYFGIGGLVIFYVVQPLLDKLRTRINPNAIIISGILIAAVMISDFIITVTGTESW